jgi:hypothetical protein
MFENVRFLRLRIQSLKKVQIWYKKSFAKNLICVLKNAF